MPSPLMRYADEKEASDGRNLYWSRVSLDDLPYRGQQPPLLSDAEYEEKTTVVSDPKVRFFDIEKPEELEAYLQIKERAYNGWYLIVFEERFWRGSTKHYLEWVERYREDGTRPAFTPLTENGYGGYPGRTAANGSRRAAPAG